MNQELLGDRARVTVLVRVPIEETFRIFTEEIDQWWRRGPKFRNAGSKMGLIYLEPNVGGRLFESFEKAGQTTVFEVGKVVDWQPPQRLAFTWRASNFTEGESTLVEVDFKPSQSGTLVTVTHSGFSKLRADHPVRHGQEVAAFIGTMGRWWGELLSALREHAE
ncbi:MAG: SRPBCC domain-containing protein [Polyangiaceae bacterium]|nr:SRPBCC domain-containing protein [Polyangiaceae bacterium]